MVVSESPELAVEILQVYKRVNSIAGVPVRAVISHGFKKWFNITNDGDNVEGNAIII
jgi:hypothetical protein